MIDSVSRPAYHSAVRPCLAVAALLSLGIAGAAEAVLDCYPLSPGNEWTYASAAVVVESDSVARAKPGSVFTLRVIAESTLAEPLGTLYTVARSFTLYEAADGPPWLSSTVTADTFFLRRTPAALYRYNDRWEPSSEPETLLVFPFAAGTTWTSLRDGELLYESALSMPEPVSVPAGDYERAWRVTRTGSLPHKLEAWYAPGIGQVRSRTETRTGGRLHVSRHDLVSYRVH